MTRTGTQPAGIVEFQGFAPTNVPAPVDDSTQNFGAKGEYIGTSLWGQKLTFKAAYTGSVYTDNISSYTVQNPFFPTVGSCTKPTAAAAGTANCGSAQMSTPPSNQMNGFSETTSADLPWNSRYMGTTSYTYMTQNAPFLPMTNNPARGGKPERRSLEPGRRPAGAEPRWRYQYAYEQQRTHHSDYTDFDVEVELPLLQLRQSNTADHSAVLDIL